MFVTGPRFHKHFIQMTNCKQRKSALSHAEEKRFRLVSYKEIPELADQNSSVRQLFISRSFVTMCVILSFISNYLLLYMHVCPQVMVRNDQRHVCLTPKFLPEVMEICFGSGNIFKPLTAFITHSTLF